MATVLLAPDKFKGSLTAAQVVDAVAAGLRDVDPTLTLVAVPVADGGDGTLAAAVAAGYRHVPVTVPGPTGQPVDSGYALRVDDDAAETSAEAGTAVVELADACGLDRLPGRRLDALGSSSAGVGAVVRAALDAGVRRIVLGIGGSASTDGGAGLLTALGARLLDTDGNEILPGGAGLEQMAAVDLSGLHPAVSQTGFVVACDVDNPLLGPTGAAAVYGPQKGAGPDDVARLDAALARWSAVLGAAQGHGPSGHPAAATPGAGAAGGVGFAALAVLGARLRPGIELVLDLTGFHDRLPGADLVVTGEGALDTQTLSGKAPAGVAAAAVAAGVPVVAVAGVNLLDSDTLRAAGIRAVYPLVELEPDVATCVRDAAPLLRRVARRLAAEQLTASAVRS